MLNARSTRIRTSLAAFAPRFIELVKCNSGSMQLQLQKFQAIVLYLSFGRTLLHSRSNNHLRDRISCQPPTTPTTTRARRAVAAHPIF